ncbi:hypothetical protein Ais01nite_18060 [Asanoa ishikariensis]|uniref:DUF998 domain-containing protein n=1 Tax=Asanoa ishikariensis TaxID=137265 RepID=A0A1H3UDY2_9ACTN|nr:DUF998 domain-containing protein [Asanoa ishikariensis]GIF63771.1 hypothetical protein Ais01nite_18060 [Asanoa ishikariensis]SDZ60578.1 Protein of unknown function [Asanoa ishikariensis]
MTATLAAPATQSTGRLLAAGAVAGPLFVAVVLAQAYTRDGFDLAQHPLSSLALGDGGWLQILNFVVCGALTIVAAVGLRRALLPGRASTWGPRLVRLGGVALIVAGIFQADPVNGYPVGTPDAVTVHGIIHSMAPAVGGIAGLVAYVVFARRFSADRERGWLAWTIAAPIAILATDAIAFSTTDFRAMLVGQLIGAVWTTSLCLKLRG